MKFLLRVKHWQLFLVMIALLFPEFILILLPPELIFPIIIPFHFLAMFCTFYVLYYVSKSLKTVELQRTVTFSDYSGEFFLMWFYFIGVWFIQPRVNAMFAGGNASTGQPLDQYRA